MTIFLPQLIGSAGEPVQDASQHKQQIRKAVEVLLAKMPYGLLLAQGNYAAFRAAAHCPADMGDCRRSRAAGKDELGQARQGLVVRLEPLVELRQLMRVDILETRYAQFAAKVEQIVLDGEERLPDVIRQSFGQQKSDRAVQLVDITHRADPQIILGAARTIPKSCRAVVPGSGGNCAESEAHFR